MHKSKKVYEQKKADLGLHRLTKRLLKYCSRRQKQTTCVVIDALKFKHSFIDELHAVNYFCNFVF